MNQAEQAELLGSILPGAIEEARSVLAWLDEGKIAIASTKNEFGYPQYVDSRTHG